MATALIPGLRKIQEKRRQGLLMHWIYDRATTALSRLGVTVEMSVTYREGTVAVVQPQPRLAGLTWGVAGPSDIAELVQVRDDASSHEEFAERHARGVQCYFVRHSGHIVAFIWCEIGGPARPRFGLTFGPQDAYIFDAYAIPSHRGQNLLPFLKFHVLRALEQQRCDNVLTSTDIFNGAAQRYKRKLGARPLAANLYVGVPGRFERLFVLHRFRADVPPLMSRRYIPDAT